MRVRALRSDDAGMATTDVNPNAPIGFDGEVISDHALGWLTFAGTILGLAGVMRIVDSIWAFRYHGALPENLQDGTLGSDLKTHRRGGLRGGVVPLGSGFPLLL